MRARQKLVEDLGGKCEECGETSRLQIDHIYKPIWMPRRVGSDMRLIIYRREAKLGLVRLLCVRCNRRKGEPTEEIPEHLMEAARKAVNGRLDPDF